MFAQIAGKQRESGKSCVNGPEGVCGRRERSIQITEDFLEEGAPELVLKEWLEMAESRYGMKCASRGDPESQARRNSRWSG